MKLPCFIAAMLVSAGCTGNSCNPPPILLPLLVPVALVDRIRHPPQPHVYQPTVGGTSVATAFVLCGSMTEEELRSQQTYFYWTDHDYRIPGSATGRFDVSVASRKIEGVVYRDATTNAQTTYYFDLTDVKIIEKPTRRQSQPPRVSRLQLRPHRATHSRGSS